MIALTWVPVDGQLWLNVRRPHQVNAVAVGYVAKKPDDTWLAFSMIAGRVEKSLHKAEASAKDHIESLLVEAELDRE